MPEPKATDMPEHQPGDVLSLDILALTNESQMENGLRAQDYARYRQYCTRRLQRLRKALNMKHSKSGKTFTPQRPTNLTDVRCLHLLLYETERAWAYAMELKRASAGSGSEARMRYHLIRRLRKAQASSRELEVLCSKDSGKVDPRTGLDVKGYAALMTGYLAFEKGEWQRALDNFVSARTIYQNLAGAGTFQQEALAQAAIDQIDPNIRFCAYKLRLSGDGKGQGSKDVEDLVNDLRKQRKGTGLDMLEAEMKGVLTEARGQKAKDLSEITWRGRTVAIKNPNLAIAILNAQAAVAELEERRSESHELQLESFDKLLAAWAEAEKIAKRLVKEDEEATQKVRSSKSGVATEELAFLHIYTVYTLHARTIQRNLLLISQIQKSSQHKDQDVVRLYDDVLKNLETVRDAFGTSLAHGLPADIEARIAFYRAWRTVHLANAYDGSKQHGEAYALFEKAQDYASQARANLLLAGKSAKGELLPVSETEITELDGRVRGGKCKVQAACYLEQGGERVAAGDDVGEVALIKRLDAFPTSITSKARPNQPLLIDFPPMFDPVAAKPLFFDVAFNYVEYPSSLSERAGTNKTGDEKESGFLRWFRNR